MIKKPVNEELLRVHISNRDVKGLLDYIKHYYLDAKSEYLSTVFLINFGTLDDIIESEKYHEFKFFKYEHQIEILAESEKNEIISYLYETDRLTLNQFIISTHSYNHIRKAIEKHEKMKLL